MYSLSHPFIDPEKVMLRTSGDCTTDNICSVGSCHMGVPVEEVKVGSCHMGVPVEEVKVGSCHMGVPVDDSTDKSNWKRGFFSSSYHKEVVVLG